MEIYKAKGHLNYQSNRTNTKRSRALSQVDGKGNIIKSKEEKVILSKDATETSNFINAIELQNKKLREISWIQSHLVRGPLARIMGLVQIMDKLKDRDEMATVLEYLLLSANELDNAIKQISDKSIPVLIW